MSAPKSVPPPLTDADRLAGALKGVAARQRHAELSSLLKSGSMLLEELLRLADTEKAAASMRSLRVVESMPGVGRATATRLLAEMRISERTRVGGLGRRQRAALLERFPDREALSEAVNQQASPFDLRAGARAVREGAS